MKNGFTLVELSIVLVIIGLLVGGILVGQSLIDSAKISSQIRQIQQFDIAVSQFKSRFRGIPGDSPLFINDGDGADADSARGDGDRFLQNQYRGQFCQIALYIGECDEFWKQLGETGMIDGTYSNDYSAGIIPDVGAPRGIYDHVNVLPYHIVGSVNTRDDRNYFIL